ncbi:uncharacterized protein LOC101887998 [Musca domestica]|uniref:Uncharacterized protein LOC101887998 n=1 Tax=Musca domestica TaxID=7370 RepID=A0A1I8N1L8_MUSDO|nr:uncharacterized protein LOC101887998 [Musca domestica]
MAKFLQILFVAFLAVALVAGEPRRFQGRRNRFLARQEVEEPVTPYPTADELKPEVPFDEAVASEGQVPFGTAATEGEGTFTAVAAGSETTFTSVAGQGPLTPVGGQTPLTPVDEQTTFTTVNADGETTFTAAGSETTFTSVAGQAPLTPVNGQTPLTPVAGQTPFTSVAGQSPFTPVAGQAPFTPDEVYGPPEEESFPARLTARRAGARRVAVRPAKLRKPVRAQPAKLRKAAPARLQVQPQYVPQPLFYYIAH